MSAGRSRIVCFGEMLIRLSVTGRKRLAEAGPMEASVGGAEANVAMSLSGFGHVAAMVTALPDNALGEAALTALRAHGVDISGVRRGPGRMGLYFVEPGAGLRPTEVLYDRAGSSFAMCAGGDWDWPEILKGAAWLHLSGVIPALGPGPAEAAGRAIGAAGSAGAQVSFDGNFRPTLWRGREGEAPAALARMLEGASLAFLDERDIGLILGRPFDQTDPLARRRAAAQTAFGQFPKLQRIAATVRSPPGETTSLSATLFTRTALHRAGPLPLAGAVDRIGAGDAFAAGLLHGLITGMAEAEALDFALAAGALKHFYPGDVGPLGVEQVAAVARGERVELRR